MEIRAGDVFLAALAVITVASVVLGLLRGKGKPRKRLLYSLLLLGGALLICFGGEAVLEQFDMGWRCGPFNFMLVLCVVLFAVVLLCCMEVLYLLFNTPSPLQTCGFYVLPLVLVITLLYTWAYFAMSSWEDRLVLYDGQMIVCADDQHGGSCSWRYYADINFLVHGAEIEHEGSWIGCPPRRIG